MVAPRRASAGILALTFTAAAFALLLFTSRLSAQATQAASAPAALASTIDRLIADPAFSRGAWGISIHSLDRHETVYEHDAGKLLMPGSTLKLVTLAAAAERLGWDFAYSTALWRSGTIEGDVLNGDLIVVGTGDPSFDDWDGAATAQFGSWAARLKADGIHKVNGRIIGDDNLFDDSGLMPGWSWDDIGLSYAAAVSALQFNENTVVLTVTSGNAIGEAAQVEIAPAYATIQVRNQLTTTADPTGSVTIRQVENGTAVVLGGSIPKGGSLVRRLAVANPTLYFANAARTALVAQGIDITGAVVDVDDLIAPPSGPFTVVADFRSPPLRELAKTMMQLSQNLFAESLLRTLGVLVTREGTASAGVAAVRDSLAAWGIPVEDFVIVDGSGLSRYDLLTARAATTVLAHVYADDTLREPYLATLPVAGVSGTLVTRMKGTPAEGNVHAKTGSFGNARAVAGFVRTADGEMLAFSIVANNYNIAPPAVDRATDAIIAALARFRR